MPAYTLGNAFSSFFTSDAATKKIFVELFMRVGEKGLRDCAEERDGQKKAMSAQDKRRTEDAYQSIFLRLVVKKLVEEMRYRSDVTAADLVHNRREYYAAIEFLLDRDSKAEVSDVRAGAHDVGADGRTRAPCYPTGGASGT